MAFPLEKIVTVVPELSNSPLGTEYTYVGIHHRSIYAFQELMYSKGDDKTNTARLLLIQNMENAEREFLNSKAIPRDTAYLVMPNPPSVASVLVGDISVLIISYAATALVPRLKDVR